MRRHNGDTRADARYGADTATRLQSDLSRHDAITRCNSDTIEACWSHSAESGASVHWAACGLLQSAAPTADSSGRSQSPSPNAALDLFFTQSCLILAALLPPAAFSLFFSKTKLEVAVDEVGGSDVEKKVKKATSLENSAAPPQLLHELAALSHD